MRSISRFTNSLYWFEPLKDKIPTYNIALLFSADNDHIVEIRNKLACTDCQRMPSLGIKVTYL
jgi:hypothetical protein